MDFPDPPYELYRPIFGQGPDPRRRPPAPPPPTKRFRVFGVEFDSGSGKPASPPTTAVAAAAVATGAGAGASGDTLVNPLAGQQGGPLLRAEFQRIFRSLNELLLEQCKLLHEPTNKVDLEDRAKQIVQRKTELQ